MKGDWQENGKGESLEKSPAKAARYIFSVLIINSTNIYEKPTYTSEQEKLPL